jgi:hypothetical protein
MSPSSDIETLFGHFGGNAGDYQEIGRENEASSARTRWPLLVTLDLTQPSIPAIPQRGDPLAQPGDEAAQAQSPEGDAQAANGPAEAGHAAKPQVRSKTPLFARPHRRTIPPVGNAVKPEPPRGAERFSAVPQAAKAELAASEAAVAAPVVSTTPPTLVPIASQAPAATATVPPIGNVPPVFAPAMAPVAMPPMVARTTSAAPAFRAPVPSAQGFAAPAAPAFAARPTVPASAYTQPASAGFAARVSAPAAPTAPAAPAAPGIQPPSILGKLFKPAAPSTSPAARTPAAEAAPAALGSLFERLRGDAPTAATPAPHSWLTNGPRRS